MPDNTGKGQAIVIIHNYNNININENKFFKYSFNKLF